MHDPSSDEMTIPVVAPRGQRAIVSYDGKVIKGLLLKEGETFMEANRRWDSDAQTIGELKNAEHR